MRRIWPLVALGLALGMGVGAGSHGERASALLPPIVCAAGSYGSQYSYISWQSCPLPGSMSDSSTLNKWDPVLLAYYVAQSTFSGCGPLCQYDAAFDANNSGSGNYYVQGTHTVSIPGYYPAYGLSYYGPFVV